MELVDIKNDWQDLTNDLYFATKNIRENRMKIFDSLKGELLPEPDAIVLLQCKVCPIWKTITPRTSWLYTTEELLAAKSELKILAPNVHALFSIYFNNKGEMRINEYIIAGIELKKGQTLYQSIQDFNDETEVIEEVGRMEILYIIEE